MSDPWSAPEVVARFSVSPPNPILMAFAELERKKYSNRTLLDVGCGAGCNAVPLARQGWNVTGIDLSESMLKAANRRAVEGNLTNRLRFEKAPMDQLPVADCSFDFIVAHGIWNLAKSGLEFRKAVREAARAAKADAALFIYTFSRNTLPKTCNPVTGETFVYTEFLGRPQCFLTENQLIEEMEIAGFKQEPNFPITEYSQHPASPKPAIYEGVFRRNRA